MKYYLYLLFTLIPLIGFSQNIEGVVYADGVPLQDVNVKNSRTEMVTSTDSDGSFTFSDIQIGDQLIFSYIGYETKTVVVNSQNINGQLNVALIRSDISLTEIQINKDLNTLEKIVAIDVQNNPVRSSQEILRRVPGLFIGQHAGGGKAEQIFLRGFDVDHGTDVAINVDGIPVNQVSHAHGQGYSDLHFVIPETIEAIEFGKGPYYTNQGNFNTAGYVGFRTRKRINQNSVSLEYGGFDSFRTVGQFKLLDTQKSSAYVATSYYITDGPFESSQNFNRFNILGKYNYKIRKDEELTLTLSRFTSKWDASGQIPQRAVDQGLISRFGAIDDTEGGQTSRTNVLVEHERFLTDSQKLTSRAFYSQYDFELFSNFTFFLEDPINGDQIRQFEDRNTYGFQTVLSDKFFNGNTGFAYDAGIGLRYDNVDDIQLSRTANRKELLERLAFGDVDETNFYSFVNTEFEFGDFKLNPGLRLDYFKFDYVDNLVEEYETLSEDKFTFSPKLNLIYTPTDRLQLFAKTGIGFHSNDTRVVVANQGEDILPSAYGADLGSIFKVTDKLVFNAALWYLFLEQEFVYVGDAGIVEPSGKTRRTGVDLGLRYEPLPWLYFYGDATYTYARAIDEPDGEDLIPLAPDFTVTGGVNVQDLNNFSGGINYRFLGDRPANEDNSIVAEGYFVTDANINYTYKNYTFGLIVENLFDVEWKETQFATESRLRNEAQPVEEIHVTPGTPFFLRARVSATF